MTPDGSSFRLFSAEAADTIDVLSAVLRRATDLTLALRRDGTIQAAILNPQSDMGPQLDHWIGHHINSVLTLESQEKIARVLHEASSLSETGTLNTAPMELNHRDIAGNSLSLRYSFVKVGSDDTLLLLGHDLSQIADAQQALVRTQQMLEDEVREQRERDTLFALLKENANDAVVFVNTATQRVIDLTEPARRALGAAKTDISDKPLPQFAANAQEATKLTEALLSPNAEQKRLEITLKSGEPVTVSFKRTRTARDFVTVCQFDKSGDSLSPSDIWAEVAHSSPDAIVLTNANGVIEKNNPAFLELSEARGGAEVEGLSMAQFLGRGQVDWNVISDMTSEKGAIRQYQTQLRSAHGSKVGVTASAAAFNIRGEKFVALALREHAPEFSAEDAALRDAESVSELVGKASLKDIVSQTTEVIEKICIETAIKMTKNNRFAAAEMLNLSRQSLYVKLRKYGLIERSDDA